MTSSASATGSTDAPTTAGSRRSFASKNLNALTKAPAVQRGADRPGDVTRPAYGAGGRLLVLGSKIRDTAASGNLATPVPVNTPSMRSENNGQDISVPLVPSGGVGWGANKQPASPPPPPKEEPPSAPAARPERYVPPNKAAFARDRTGEGAGAGADVRGYPPPRAPSERPPYGQDGQGYGLQTGREGSPLGERGGYRRPGLGVGGSQVGQGHRLTESDFPLEMGGSTKTEKAQQLRPRGGMGTEQTEEKADVSRTSRGGSTWPATSSPSANITPVPSDAPPGPSTGDGSGPGPRPSHGPGPGFSAGDRDRVHPSPLGEGRPGPQDGRGYYGPPPISSRMGDGRSSVGPRSGSFRGGYGSGMANGFTRDGRGGPGYGHHHSDFRGCGGHEPGGWDGARRWVPPAERDIRDRGPDRDRERNWERVRERDGGHAGGDSVAFSPRATPMSSHPPSADQSYSSANRTSYSRRPTEGHDGSRSSPAGSPAVTPTVQPAMRPPSPREMSEEDRKKAAELVAEEARAFAERERRLAEKSDEVEKGVALRARMELERLKEEKEQRAQTDAERRRLAEVQTKSAPASAADDTSRPTAANADTKNSNDPHHEGDQREGAGGRGYEPDGYGRDDPYRRQEDVERERAAQQAAAAALSPATSGGWRPGAPAPAARPPPKIKALLARGQKEVVEASTGARVIQARQIPPASPVVVAKTGPPHDSQGSKRQTQQRPAVRDSPRAVKPEETHGKQRGEPSQLLLADRPEKQQQTSQASLSRPENNAGQLAQASDAKSRVEPSSLSLQWLTPRREGADSGNSHSGAPGKEHMKKGAPSAWTQPATDGRAKSGRGAGGAIGSLSADQSSGTVAHGHTTAGGGTNLSSRSPVVRPGEPEQAPPSPFNKDAGRTFSSLFMPPGHGRGQGDLEDSAGGDARAGGFPQGGNAVERDGLERDWPEAGRGPPLREHKRIFDHKTGKMRDVEDSDKSRGVNDRPPRLPLQDARMDGRGAPPADTRHHQHAAPRPFQVDKPADDTPSAPDAGPPEAVTKRGEPTDRPTEEPAGEAQQRDRRESLGDDRRFGRLREYHSGGRGGGRGGGQGTEERREWGWGRSGGGKEWDDRRGDSRENEWGGRGRGGGGRGDGSGRNFNKTWERGVRPVIASRPAAREQESQSRGQGNEREQSEGSQARSSRRRVFPLDEPAGSPAVSSSASSAPSAASPRPLSTKSADSGPIASRAPEATAPPSPAVHPERAEPGKAEWPAKMSEPTAPLQSPCGRRTQPPLSPSWRQDSTQSGHPTVAGPSPPRPSSASTTPSGAGTAADDGGFASIEEDREAIRARDERERDFAVQQRRSLDLGDDKDAERQQHMLQEQQQQRDQKEMLDKKEADRERVKTRRAEREKVRREQREREADRHRAEELKARRREARRKESRERPPRTKGALYRRCSNAPAGGPEFVNADVPEGSVDPLQARWDAVTVEVSRDQEHEHDRNFRQPRAGSNHMNTHNTKDPVSGRKESFQGYSKDGAVRDGKRGAMRPAEVPTGELCGVGSWASGSGRDRDGRGQRGQKRAVKVEPSAEELERLAKEQEIEREANAKEEREKLKEARKERKKLKRGGGEDTSTLEGSDHWSPSGSGLGANVDDIVGETLTAGRVVVDKNDQLGINMGQFDTAEFEVVKSRKELQKERKEQRDQEERAAAERALQKAQAEAAAARKAANQLARENLRAQRELNRAEARKVEAQRRAHAQAKARANKGAAAATIAAANASAASAPRGGDSKPSEEIRAPGSSVVKQATEVSDVKPTPSDKPVSEGSAAALKSTPAASTAPQRTTSPPTAAGPTKERSTYSPDLPSSSPSTPAVARPVTSPTIQFGDIAVELQSSTERSMSETTVDDAAQDGLCEHVSAGPSTTAITSMVDNAPSKHDEQTKVVTSPSEHFTAAVSSGAIGCILSASAPSKALSKDGTDIPVEVNTTLSPVSAEASASPAAPGPQNPPMESDRVEVSPSESGGDCDSATEPPTQISPDDKDNTCSTGSPDASLNSDKHTQHTRQPVARGLLSSPSLAGSIPAPHMSAAWKPLPVGMAATAFGTVDNSSSASAGAASAAAAATAALGSGGAQFWGVPPQTTKATGNMTSPAGTSGQHHAGMTAQHLHASQAMWMQGNGGRGDFGRNPAEQVQLRSVGPASAPAAPGAGGWSPGQAIVQEQAGGIMGMVGTNGGGTSVGGRLRSSTEGFEVGAGGGGAELQPAVYGALASASIRGTMVRRTSGGQEGSPTGSHGHRSNSSAQPGGMPTPSAGGTSVGAPGGAFGGFMMGYQSPGARQPVMPGGANWRGTIFSHHSGSPGVGVTGIAGGHSPPAAQRLQQQLQPQQQQPPYSSFVPCVTPSVVSSAQQTMVTTLPRSPGPAAAALPSGVTAVPEGDNANTPSSGLAAEARPFIPARVMGPGTSATWGAAGMTNSAGLHGQAPVQNAVILHPTASQGMQFGHGGGMAIGVAMRPGQMAGLVPVMNGMAPANVNLNVRGGMIAGAASPAMFATQQMQQQIHQQEQIHQRQLLQLQHQHQQWLANSAAGVHPAPQQHQQIRGQFPAGATPAQGGSPTGWGGSQKGTQNGVMLQLARTNGGSGAASGLHRLNARNASSSRPLASRSTPAAGASAPGPHANGARPDLQQQQGSATQEQGQGDGIRGPAGGGGARAEGDGDDRHSSPPSHDGKKNVVKKTDSQALYVPKRSSRGPGVAPPPAVPAAGS